MGSAGEVDRTNSDYATDSPLTEKQGRRELDELVLQGLCAGLAVDGEAGTTGTRRARASGTRRPRASTATDSPLTEK
ncbi:unnamed protein product [Linum trigynum]|uniref:Uncharacterized protein n=1 Tax=Linum trigynum TaxID=586398 RepID=A0AAV2FUS0_9ROSI